jgi:catechol 2,3-dioxygenase-like lactoylglutathione lyase family enzyme
MIAHACLIVSDYDKLKKFYESALKPLGYTLTMDHPEWMAGGYFDGKNTDFWISQKKGVTAGFQSHVAFETKSKKEVDDFYAAALAAGGKDNGAPGYRKHYWPGYYAAFVHDADGNNVEAVYFDYEEAGEKRP